NSVKQDLEPRLEQRKAAIESVKTDARLESEWIDLTAPAPGVRPGSLHPITQVQRELEELFVSLGFTVLDGPEVETEHYNFDALNIPADHPAREMQDTFWLEGGNLLRTHTSPVQVRGMERFGPPLRMIAPGRAFRNESVDASHEHTFYQLEGMMIDRDVSVANLIYFMKTLLTAIFHRDVTVRLRPGFFPFVEPGFELDIQCLICGGSGCPVCKQSGWVELLPCGLVHPAVLRHGGVDPGQWNGFAFGLGLTCLAGACEATVVSAEPVGKGHNQKAVVETAKYGIKTLICGAPNCRPGLKTVYVPLGVKSIDGVDSDGMLASAAELGISRDDKGIL